LTCLKERMVNVFADHITLATRRPFSWRVFWIVWGCTILGVVAVLPYARELTSATRGIANGLPLPPMLLLVLQVLQSAVLYGALAGVGLLLACRVGLGLPFVEGRLNRRPIKKGRATPI
jgi:hypothetical protein